MGVGDTRRGDGTMHRRAQAPSFQGMLDKFSRAGPYDIDRRSQIVLASENHNRQAKLAVTDLLDQRPNPHAGKIHGRDDTTTCVGSELSNQSFCAIESSKVELFPGQGLRDSAALSRQGRNDVDDIAQWPPGIFAARLWACTCRVRTEGVSVTTCARQECARPDESTISETTYSKRRNLW